MKNTNQTENSNATAGHTPGPWTVHNTIGNDTPNEFDGLTVQSEYGLVVRVQSEKYAGPHVDPENQANARLIAAAPELLGALKDMAERWKRVSPLFVNKEYFGVRADTSEEICRSAIARATIAS